MNLQQVVVESQNAYKGFLRSGPPSKDVTATTDLKLMSIIPFFFPFHT